MKKEQPLLFYLQLLITIIFVIAMFGFENNPSNLVFRYLSFLSLFILGIVTFWSGWRVMKGEDGLSIYTNKKMAWLHIITGSFVSIMTLAISIMIFFVW